TPQLMTDIYYNDTQLAPILPLSLHDALPICTAAHSDIACIPRSWARWASTPTMPEGPSYSEASTPSSACTPGSSLVTWQGTGRVDRKSTRLNSSHVKISYAVFCLKKKKETDT